MKNNQILHYYGQLHSSVKKLSPTPVMNYNTIKISSYCLEKKIKIDIFFYPNFTNCMTLPTTTQTITTFDGGTAVIPVLTNPFSAQLPHHSYTMNPSEYLFKTIPIQGEMIQIVFTIVENDGSTHTFVPKDNAFDGNSNSHNHYLHFTSLLSDNETFIS